MSRGPEPELTATRGETILPVAVTPRANRDAVIGWQGGALKVLLKAPPVEGKANAALIKFLAKTLGVKRNQIEIAAGRTSRHKKIRLKGLTEDEILSRLPPAD
ncbi:MAG: YggU family protein [Proteobacteria bacterium]|nr:YggU family protein [Pseudomonadota bacterium]MBU1740119.1 YggU family protein [Pseudomonadota bacterium]